jgi:hypothetical protein
MFWAYVGGFARWKREQIVDRARECRDALEEWE